MNPITIRVLLCVAVSKGLEVRHFDVKTAFLNGDLRETIYMQQPEGFESQDNPNSVCKLQKSLYGLKQSARAWNEKLDKTLIAAGFKRSDGDCCLYIKHWEDNTIYLVVHVDDILCASSIDGIRHAESIISFSFQLKDLGNISNYLGVEVEKNNTGYYIHQRQKIEKLVTGFGLNEAKPARTPMEGGFFQATMESPLLPDNIKYRQAIGSLLYLSTMSRPDISAAVGILARRVEKPSHSDWNAVKRVIRYLKSTCDMKLRLGSENDITLCCYVDADWAGDSGDRKSISGVLLKVGNNPIAWFCKKQTTVSLSSTEAEFTALSFAVQEIVWLRMLLKDMGYNQTDATAVYEDNLSCIRFIENEKSSARIKHLDVKRCFVKDLINKRDISLNYCPSEENEADILTKPLLSRKFLELTVKIGLHRLHH